MDCPRRGAGSQVEGRPLPQGQGAEEEKGFVRTGAHRFFFIEGGTRPPTRAPRSGRRGCRGLVDAFPAVPKPVFRLSIRLSPRPRSPLLGDFGFSAVCGNPARLGRRTTHGSGGPGFARGKSKGLSGMWRVNQVRSELLRVVRRYCFQRGTYEGCTARASGRAQSRGPAPPGRETAPTCRR